MDELRRDFRKVQEETILYKSRIAELESQLSQLRLEKGHSPLPFSRSTPNSPMAVSDDSTLGPEWSSLLEVNSRHALDASARAAEQQLLLSSTQQENAELKRLIADKECENAELTIESQSLRSQLQRSSSRSGCELEILKSEHASLQASSVHLQESNATLEKGFTSGIGNWLTPTRELPSCCRLATIPRGR
jgi:regulator of replication initiation timing